MNGEGDAFEEERKVPNNHHCSFVTFYTFTGCHVLYLL